MNKNNIIPLLTGVLLFIPFLGQVNLFDWDEINFAECAREMIVSNDYSSVKINFLPFWEKPPLFIWMQALSMNIFGINEFAARLPNAVCGMITLFILYRLGKKIKDELFGTMWMLAYAGSFLPHLYFKSGIIDPWFNLFIFLGLTYWFFFTTDINSKDKNRHLVLSALFTGLAVLTKGPVALLITILCVVIYWALKRFPRNFISLKQILLYGMAIILIGSSWFIIEIAKGRADIIKEFIDYQVRLLQTEDAGHGGPIYYHVVVLLAGCFPASVFALGAFGKSGISDDKHAGFKRWMVILLCIVLIVFSLVKTKIIHYSSLAYFPITFLASSYLHDIISGKQKWPAWNKYLFIGLSILWALILAAPQFIDRYKQKIIEAGIIKDDFAVANLGADVHWNGMEFLVGLLFLIAVFGSLLLFRKNKRHGIIMIFISSLLTINIALTVIAPKIEGYSQYAAIEFYERLESESCYIQTLGFKSYAHLFYANVKEEQNTDKMLSVKADKPTYFVSKITAAPDVKAQYPALKELYRKNGFVFFKKE